METWRPAHVANSTIGCQVSNPGLHTIRATYTFGHGPLPKPEDAKTAALDNQAATWWAPSGRPSTNDAANADIEAFWAKATQAPAETITQLTGKDVAVAAKQAGRGTHVTLGFMGNEFTRSSKYKDDFCNGGAAGSRVNAGQQYEQAKKAARANRALGTGASLSLAQMW